MALPLTQTPVSLGHALALVARPGYLASAGGTEVDEGIRQGILSADVLVSLDEIPEVHGLLRDALGGLRIGAATPLAVLAADARIRRDFPLLAETCAGAGPADIVEHGTLGGNLLQRPRCNYFRLRVPCFKNGGAGCPAQAGGNRMLAILEGGPCHVVQRSDVASALVALDATLELVSTRGRRSVPAAEFFVLPTERRDRETVCEQDELLVAIGLPSGAAGGVQRWSKLRDDALGFSVVSLAAVRRRDGEARLVLGGVSPRPYRVYTSIEEETTAGGLDEETIEGLAERALLDAVPMSQNGYKVELAAGLLRDAIRELAKAE
jgi:xanthine dehydrogenase YagS FAD-binding subunit